VKELPEALEKAAPAWVLGLVAYSIAQVVVSFLMITQKLARSVLQSYESWKIATGAADNW